jgi:hypothetical protein
MPASRQKIPLKWYTIRRIRLTGEYTGGVMAGFGLGIALIASFRPFPGSSLVMVFGFLLSPIGVAIVMRAQDRYTTNDNRNDK